MSPRYSLQELAELLGAELHGPPDLPIHCVCSADAPRPQGISFLDAGGKLEREGLAAVVLAPGAQAPIPYLSHRKPRVAFARLLELFHPEPAGCAGVHPTALVDPTAAVDPTASVGPLCILGPGVRVGPLSRLRARVVVGAGSSIGAGCRLEPNVILGAGCRVADGTVLEPWVRLEDGVELGQRVYLGSRSVIRRSARIGAGSKMDNLTFVGAETTTGEGCLMVGMTMVGEGVRLGRYVVVGAQAVVLPRLVINDMVQVAGRTLLEESLPEGKGPYGGEPARPLRQELKERALRARSWEVYRKLRSTVAP